MKFEVKVGKPLDGEFHVVVNVEPERKGHKKIVAVVAIIVFGFVASAVVYGTATGDYSIIKAIAQSGEQIVTDVAAKMAVNR